LNKESKLIKSASHISIYQQLYLLLFKIIALLLILNLGIQPFLWSLTKSDWDKIFLMIAGILSIIIILTDLKFNYFLFTMPWILVCGVFYLNIIFFNTSFYYLLFRYSIFIACMLALVRNSIWINNFFDYALFFCMIYVFSTIIFYFFPSLYDVTMLPILGHYAPGTNNGQQVYAAGLTDHYTSNGIYCATASLIAGGKLLTNSKTKKSFILFLTSFIALLLTTKRAHFLFSSCSIFFAYYITAKGTKSVRFIKLLGFVLLAFSLISLLLIIAPILNRTLQRFFTGYDDISNGRFKLWGLAWSLFKKNPLLGIGLGNYPFYSQAVVGLHYNVHNVYLQLLC